MTTIATQADSTFNGMQKQTVNFILTFNQRFRLSMVPRHNKRVSRQGKLNESQLIKTTKVGAPRVNITAMGKI